MVGWGGDVVVVGGGFVVRERWDSQEKQASLLGALELSDEDPPRPHS